MGGASMADRRRLGLADPVSAEIGATLAKVAALVRENKRFLLTTHRSPDGDGIGSASGLANALREMGKEVTLYSADPIPLRYRFIPGTDRWVATLAKNVHFEVSMVLDCASLERLGPDFPEAARRGTLVYLDHHATPGKGADVYFNDESSPAIGEVVHRLLRLLGHPLSAAVAEGLYASLVSDTGSFRYANTSPMAMRCAADLLETGVDPWRVSSNLFECEPEARIRLLSKVLATLDVSPDGKCAVLRASKKMLDETGATWDMVDGFINHARAIAGVEVAVLFSDLGDNTQKVSFRSRGNVNVAAIAEVFGGGGHFHAAGCTVPGAIDETRARLYAAVREAIQ